MKTWGAEVWCAITPHLSPEVLYLSACAAGRGAETVTYRTVVHHASSHLYCHFLCYFLTCWARGGLRVSRRCRQRRERQWYWRTAPYPEIWGLLYRQEAATWKAIPCLTLTAIRLQTRISAIPFRCLSRPADMLTDARNPIEASDNIAFVLIMC